MITREHYIENPSELHHEYYLQFSTKQSYDFVRENIGLEKLQSSKDKYFNDIIKHSHGGRGGWIWDSTPVNCSLMKELWETNSISTHTCVGKAVAREILRQNSQTIAE